MLFPVLQSGKAGWVFFDTHHDAGTATGIIKSIAARRMTNKALIKQWGGDWGWKAISSGSCVLGEFPTTGDVRLSNATRRCRDGHQPRTVPAPSTIRDGIGVDVARFGDDETTIYVRRGRDALPCHQIIIKGRDTVKTAMEVKRLIQ